MSELVTRDGNIVKDLGSWEREQLSKLRPVELDKPKPAPIRGIRLCIKSGAYRPHYTVRVYFCGTYMRTDRIYIHHHASEASALEAAKARYAARLESLEKTGQDLPSLVTKPSSKKCTK